MHGEVQAINDDSNLVAVHCQGSFSILQMLGDPVEIGDVLKFGQCPIGEHWCTNLSTAADLSVFFQDHHVAKDNILQHLLHRPGHPLRLAAELLDLDRLDA